MPPSHLIPETEPLARGLVQLGLDGLDTLPQIVEALLQKRHEELGKLLGICVQYQEHVPGYTYYTGTARGA